MRINFFNVRYFIAVLFTDDPSKWTEILTGFDEACQTMGTRHGQRLISKTLDTEPNHVL